MAQDSTLFLKIYYSTSLSQVFVYKTSMYIISKQNNLSKYYFSLQQNKSLQILINWGKPTMLNFILVKKIPLSAFKVQRSQPGISFIDQLICLRGTYRFEASGCGARCFCECSLLYVRVMEVRAELGIPNFISKLTYSN